MGFILIAVYFMILVAVLGGKMSEIKNEDQLKIISGDNTTVSEYPFAVVFLVAGKLFGAGTILDKSWILTSGFNCLWIEPKYIIIRIGSDKAEEGGDVYTTEKCIIHPKYKGFWDHNIALVKLNRSITFNNSTQPASLPLKSAASWVHKSLTVSGWGVTTPTYDGRGYFHKSLQTVMKKKDCMKVYKLMNTSMCAQNATSGPSAFDFGAPLSTKSTVVGIYQGSVNSTDLKNFPALYTDIYYFNDWIRKTLKNHGANIELDDGSSYIYDNEIHKSKSEKRRIVINYKQVLFISFGQQMKFKEEN